MNLVYVVGYANEEHPQVPHVSLTSPEGQDALPPILHHAPRSLQAQGSPDCEAVFTEPAGARTPMGFPEASTPTPLFQRLSEPPLPTQLVQVEPTPTAVQAPATHL